MSKVYVARRWFSSVESGIRPMREEKLFNNRGDAETFSRDNSEAFSFIGFFHWEVTEKSLISTELYESLKNSHTESYDDFGYFCRLKLEKNIANHCLVELIEEEWEK